MLSSELEVVDDLGFPMVTPVAEDLIKHSFNKGGNLGYNSKEEVDMAPRQRVLGKRRPLGTSLRSRPLIQF